MQDVTSREGPEPTAPKRRTAVWQPFALFFFVVASSGLAGALATYLPTQVAISVLFSMGSVTLIAATLALRQSRPPVRVIAVEAPIPIPVPRPLTRELLLARAQPIQPSHLNLTEDEWDVFDQALADARA